MKNVLRVSYLTCGLCLLINFRALATLVIPETPFSLVEKSPIVVWGSVVQIEVDSQTGYRTAVLEVKEIPKSPERLRQSKEFWIELQNRGVPRTDLVELVASAPELKVGEELVVFLRPLKQNHPKQIKRTDSRELFSLEGFYQGKLRVYQDSYGVRKVWAWNEGPDDVALSPKEIQTSKTTPRMAMGKIKAAAVVRKSEEEQGILLDSLLNRARKLSRQSEGP